MKLPTGVKIPVVRSSERIDYKRCPKKWYWAWRKGLKPKQKTFGALDLGTWMHAGLAAWYLPGKTRQGKLSELVVAAGQLAIDEAVEQKRAPDYAVEKAEELLSLAEIMADAYQKHYGNDPDVRILAVEIPLEFTFPHPRTGQIVAAHKLKPDGVFLDRQGDVWLIEHKTAQSIQTEHLVIDDQARPYGSMAEPALRELGVIKGRRAFRGIMYNYLRKAIPDDRPQNAQGQYLNKDQSISKKQPPAYFVRKPLSLTKAAKMVTLQRVRDETLEITQRTLELRTGDLHPDRISITPHKSCPKTCQFFTMCVAAESGTDTRDMERMMYYRQDPYLYEEESTEDTLSFEIA